MLLDQYTLQIIISYCDIDTKYVMKTVCKQFFNQVVITLINHEKLPQNCVGMYNGSVILTKKTLREYPINWNYCFATACYGGNINVVKLLISKSTKIKKTKKWNFGLYGACHSGNLEITKLMLKHGANDFDSGLRGACFSNNTDILDLMIKCGANNWNAGLGGACHGNNIELMSLMISRGATKCKHCKKSINEHLEI